MPITRSRGDRGYKEPGSGRTHAWPAFSKSLPKVGPLRAIDFKEPTDEDRKPVLQERRPDHRRSMGSSEGGTKRDLKAPEIDLDTGKPTKRGEYPLADVTYRELLDELAYDKFANLQPDVRDDILSFYSGFVFPPSGARLDKCVVHAGEKPGRS